MKNYSRFLTILQFIFLTYLIVTSPLAGLPVLVMMFVLSGFFLGLWAFAAMGLGNFSPFPLPRKNNRFVFSGPYRLIRHPMYTSLILIFLPMMFVNLSPLRLAAAGGLLILLFLKMRIEESRLSALHPEYEAYCRRTWRLIPYIV